MTELWKPVPSLPGYEASSAGRVRHGARILGGTADRYGYRYFNVEGKRRVKAHRVVCEAFKGPSNARHCAHLNGDPSDNRATNLVWATPKENNAHKLVRGTAQAGSNHPRAKLTPQQVEEIRSSAKSTRAIAAEFSLSQSHVVRIRGGHRWRTEPVPVSSASPLQSLSQGED